EPTIVGSDNRLIGIIVLHATPELGTALLRRKKYFGVDAVLVLFANALFRAAGARCTFVSAAERNIFVSPLSAIEVSRSGRPGDLFADAPCVAPVRLAHKTRRLISMLHGNPIDPILRIDFQMRVA